MLTYNDIYKNMLKNNILIEERLQVLMGAASLTKAASLTEASFLTGPKKSQEINIRTFADVESFEETGKIEIDNEGIDQIEEINKVDETGEISDNAEDKIKETRADEI
ncbi:17474_t:CDS:2, partial [Cetraspora pellucida]